MPTANELIEDLVTLTRGSLRQVETDMAELRADVRVLNERMKNLQANVGTDKEGFTQQNTDLTTAHKSLEQRVHKLEQSHAKYMGAAGVLGAVVGFLASLAKGLLGL